MATLDLNESPWTQYGKLKPYIQVEDPYIWQDPNGNWHLLCHRYDCKAGRLFFFFFFFFLYSRGQRGQQCLPCWHDASDAGRRKKKEKKGAAAGAGCEGM